MSGPSDDELWKDVVQQMHDALDAMGVESSGTRSALTEGVVDALKSILHPEQEADEGAPNVVVLDGGRDDEDAAPRGERPSLRVERGGDDEAPEVSVRVVTVGDEAREHWEDDASDWDDWALVELGRIRVSADGWQTLFRGASPHAYRIACGTGQLDVAVDGIVVERLEAGQTLDVESALVRVRSGDGRRATGTYARLG